MELVNPVPVDEVEPWLAALTTTLLGTSWDADFPRRVERWRREWLPERTFGVRDGGRWVASLFTDPRVITVPGVAGSYVDVAADAVAAVTVAATHRRRGLLRQMITRSLQDAVDRGEIVSILMAAEWPIYGRYGYAPSTRNANYQFLTRRAGASVSPDPSGAVRQVEPAELGKYAPTIFDRARGRWAGQVSRPGDWWSSRLGLAGYEPSPSGQGTWLMHESDDGPDGLLAWKVTRQFDPYGELGAVRVMELAAASDRAYRNLWSYLAGLDIVSEIELADRPLDEPVRWLLPDGRSLRQTAVSDAIWVRLLDVPAALTARGYAVSGRVVIDVVDDLGGYAAGRYLLDAAPDGASCTRTTGTADLRLSQRALATVYLGDQSLRALAIAGAIDELTPGALDRTDAMLATAMRPWNATAF